MVEQRVSAGAGGWDTVLSPGVGGGRPGGGCLWNPQEAWWGREGVCSWCCVALETSLRDWI